jgi:hypothetical protein
MSTTHGAVKARCHEDTTDDVYLVGAGCVVCAQVRMGLGSGSRFWNPGTWIRCVLHLVKWYRLATRVFTVLLVRIYRNIPYNNSLNALYDMNYVPYGIPLITRLI